MWGHEVGEPEAIMQHARLGQSELASMARKTERWCTEDMQPSLEYRLGWANFLFSSEEAAEEAIAAKWERIQTFEIRASFMPGHSLADLDAKRPRKVLDLQLGLEGNMFDAEYKDMAEIVHGVAFGPGAWEAREITPFAAVDTIIIKRHLIYECTNRRLPVGVSPSEWADGLLTSYGLDKSLQYLRRLQRGT